MRRLLAFFLPVLLLLLAAADVRAETCVLSGTPGTFSCPTASTYGTSPGASCTVTTLTVTGCTPTNDDTFNCDGTTCTANGDLLGQGPSQRFAAINGGDIVCRVEDGCDTVTTGSVAKTAGAANPAAGLVAIGSGSTVTLNGEYLNPATAAFQTARPSTYLYVGNLEPCGNSGDCDTSTNNTVMRLAWRASKNDEAGQDATGNDGDTLLDSNINAITTRTGTVSGDLVCFRDPNTADDMAATDSPFCYEITAKGATPGGNNEYYVEFDVRQGAIDRAGLLLAERLLAKCTVDGTPAGFRDKITFSTSDNTSCNALFNADSAAVGWAYVRVGLSGENPGRPYKITRVDDEAPGANQTTVTIFPPLDRPLADNDTVYIDYGWMPGDAFWVIRPVRVADRRMDALTVPITNTQATEQDEAGGLYADNAGVLNLTAARIDRMYSDTATNDGDIGTRQDVWYSDTTSREEGTSGVVIGFEGTNADPVTMDSIAITGGPSQGCRTGGQPACQHSINMDGGGLKIFREIGIRHNGDDGITAAGPAEVTHYISQSGADGWDSGSCIEPTAGTHLYRGIVCGDEMHADTGVTFSIPTGVTGTVDDILIYGPGESKPFGVTTASTEMRFSNLVLLATDIGNPAVAAPLVPEYVNKFWIQDVQYPDGTTQQRISDADSTVEITDGAFVDIRQADAANNGMMFAPSVASTNTKLSNVALVNFTTAAGGSFWMHRPVANAVNATIENVTFWNNVTAGTVANKLLAAGFTSANPGTITYRNLLFAGFIPSGQVAFDEATDTPTKVIYGDNCFFTYASAAQMDHYDGAADTLLTTAESGGVGRRIRDRDPQMVDPYAYFPRVDTKPGSPCGNAGVKRGKQAPGVAMGWALSKVHGVSLKMDDSLGTRGGARRAQ